MSNKLFVGGLAWETTDEALRKAFESFGEVTGAKVILDRETGRSRGFGFVTFATEDQARVAMEQMQGATLDGRKIRIDFASDGPRRGGGGYSRGPRPSGPAGGYGQSDYPPRRRGPMEGPASSPQPMWDGRDARPQPRRKKEKKRRERRRDQDMDWPARRRPRRSKQPSLDDWWDEE